MRRLLALTLLALALPCAAQAAKPKPLPPDQAQAAMNAPGVQTLNTARRVTPAEAMAAASIPGAQTEVMPGMTLAQATGADPTAAPTFTPRQLARALAGSGCYNTGLGYRWGLWPYQRIVNDYTYYCWSGFYITYRTTHVQLSGLVCSWHDPYAFKISGGVGWTYVYVQSGGSFDCPTNIPWITLHSNNWMRNYYGAEPVYWTNEVSGP